MITTYKALADKYGLPVSTLKALHEELELLPKASYEPSKDVSIEEDFRGLTYVCKASNLQQVNDEFKLVFNDLQVCYNTGSFHFHGSDLGPVGHQIKSFPIPVRVDHLSLGEWVKAGKDALRK